MTQVPADPFPALVLANGRFVGPEEPALPATDRGFLLGVAVFETIRVEAGVALFLEEHLERMAEGARRLALPPPFLEPAAAVARFLDRTGLDRGVVRVTRTAGTGEGPGSIVVHARPLPSPLPDEVRLEIAEHRKVPGDPLESVKTVSRVRSALAREAAAARGALDALVRTTDGDFAEGTVTNLFVAIGGALRTPPKARGILGGVVRDLLLRELPARGVPVTEARIEAEDLRVAAEVLVTNAVVGPLGARVVAGLREDLPGERGEIARAARAGYRAAVDDYLERRGVRRRGESPAGLAPS